MNGLATLLPFLVGIALAVSLVAGFVLDRKRRDKLMAYCVARGWQYVDEDPSLVGAWTGEPFGHGDSRRARSVIRGRAQDRDFVAFEYSYETHSTDSQGRRTTTTHRYAVYAVALPAYLPRLEVVPESLFGRIGDAVGLTSDIDLESEAFNRRFTVRAQDRKFATDVLSPRTMEYLLSAPPAAWRTDGARLVRWETGRLDPTQVVVATGVLDRLADGIPTFVWKDHGYDPQT